MPVNLYPFGASFPVSRGRYSKSKSVIVYADESVSEPLTDWLYGPRDIMGRERILARVARLEQGNYGDCESVGEGVSELRLYLNHEKL